MGSIFLSGEGAEEIVESKALVTETLKEREDIK